MAAIASSPFSGIARGAEKRTLSSVISVSENNITTVRKTIQCWVKTGALIRGELISSLRADPASKAILQDIKLLDDCQVILGCRQKLVIEFLKNLPQTKILLAVDSLGEIQSMACYGMDFEDELQVRELATAPSNIRWKTKLTCIAPPIYGGGTLLMHAIFKVALTTKKPKVGLLSTETGNLFYKKLGMMEDELGFVFILSKRSHHENMERALAKAFGPSFKYSLLY
jgi:hypothetical protein